MTGPRRVHDMGGLDGGPVCQDEHAHEPWEKRVDAIRMLCGKRGLLRTDEMRRNIEDLGPGVYDELGYYERWCASVTNVLLQKGVITVDELGRKMAEVEARWAEARKS
jgi:nitrile hydratase subunit beta